MRKSDMKKVLLLAAGLVFGLGISVRGADKVDFVKQIKPIFAENCYKCHAGEKHKGNFKLDSVAAIEKGGKEGSDIVPNHPEKSDVYHRITLKPDDDDIMPPSDKGKPLNKAQTDLIKTWIEQGADFGGWKQDEVKTAAADTGPGNDAAVPGMPALPQVAAASNATLDHLRQAGAQCLPLCQGSNLLVIEFTSTASQVSDQQVQMLADAAPQIYDLNLSNTKVTDAGLAALAKMTNLHRLHLEKTAVTDAGLAHLKGLENLEYLNLYHTGVSDQGVSELSSLKHLKNLYVWQTKVTDAGAESLKKANPTLSVDTGWKEPAKPETAPAQTAAK